MHKRTTIALAVGVALCGALPALASPPRAGVQAKPQQAVSASATLNSNGRLAVHRESGLARAGEREELHHWRDAQRERRAALRHHSRFDRDDFVRRDRDDFARRDSDKRFAAERREAREFPSSSAQRNSNGWFAADRDFGLARAEERHELHGLDDSQRASRFSGGDRFRSSRGLARANAELKTREPQAGPRFVNVVGASQAPTNDRDDLTAGKGWLRASGKESVGR